MTNELDLIRRLIAEEEGLCVVATTRMDSSVQASVVNGAIVDHPVSGEPCIGLVARGDSAKLKLLRNSGRATVVFRHGWEWAGVEGQASLFGPEDEMEGLSPTDLPPLLRLIFVSAGGTHNDFEEYDKVMSEERRTAVLVAIEKILTNRRS